MIPGWHPQNIVIPDYRIPGIQVGVFPVSIGYEAIVESTKTGK